MSEPAVYNQKMQDETYRQYQDAQDAFWKKVSENRAKGYVLDEAEKNEKPVSKGRYLINYFKFMKEYYKENIGETVLAVFLGVTDGSLLILPLAIGMPILIGVTAPPAVLATLKIIGFEDKTSGTLLRKKHGLKVPQYIYYGGYD